MGYFRIDFRQYPVCFLRGGERVETALTAEQQKFAEKNHNLIYKFLNAYRIPEDDFYDIVVFGYLQAVKSYFEKPGLSGKYAFSTIAWNSMRTSLANHYQEQSRLKRKAVIIDIDAVINDDGEIISFQEALTAPDSYMMDFETELLMIELASRLSEREMEIIRMKINGCGIREIAKAQKMPVKGVKELLAGLRETVLAVCYK
jgi:RNA polymerase sigma factor (sigma-70 family)